MTKNNIPIFLFLFFPLTLLANPPANPRTNSPAPYEGNWWERQTLYLATDSICFDGIVAIIAGHGCNVLNTKDIESGAVKVWCESSTRNDSALDYEYVLWNNNNDLPSKYQTAELMCVDTSFTLLRK
tara:strand:+ start:2445 stop:2825 length:381 start_codon:yes stop_codon:yes gene_type:complete